MPARGGVGFPGWALVVAFVLCPALVLIVKRRLRIAAERREEVRRLAALAAEEAERAEEEASLVYVWGSVVEKEIERPRCAVCFSPTTTRCSRCKAVRYCSGKCQIIHWRQGHKDECHPPQNDYCHNVQISSSDAIGEHGNQSDVYENSVETFSARPKQSESKCSSESFGKHDSFANQDGTFGVESSSSPVEKSSETLLSDVLPDNHAEMPGPLPCDASDHNSQEVLSDSQLKSVQATHSAVVSESVSVNDGSCLNDSTQSIPSLKSEDVKSQESVPSMPSTSIGPSKDTTGCREGAHNLKVAEAAQESDSVKPQFSDSKSIQLGAGSPSQTYSRVSSQKENIHITHCVTDSSDEVVASEDTPQTYLKAKSFPGISNSTCSTGGKDTEHSKHPKPVSAVHAASVNQGLPVPKENYSKIEKPPIVPMKSSMHVTSSLDNNSDLKTSVRKVVQQCKSLKISRHYSSGLGSDLSGNQNHKMLFPYDVFIKLYNCDKLDLRPCGLINCGNSCFANAVLQCLAFTRPLTAYLLEGLHSKTCPKTGWCFTCEFESLVQKAKQGRSPLSPIGILSHMGNLGRGREEDAHEFLRYAVDAMQSVCLKEAGKNALGQQAEETTLIQQMFGGYLRSKIKCMRCQGKSERHDRMMDLTVEIHGDVGSLEDALAHFTATEVLDGENKYHCTRCNSYERAKKKLTVSEAPNILTIALKRFQSGKFGKLNKSVRFPEYLNLAPYMSRTDDKSPVYRLYAVVVHLDVMNAAFSGHYVCYVKSTQGKWHKLDDSKVKPVELENVLSKGAYMLFYARCSPRAPSLLRKARSQDHDSTKKNWFKVQPAARDVVRTSSISVRRESSSHQHPERTPGNSALFDPYDFVFERFQHPKTDSPSSDSSSLFSCSDEGSWSTESSTRDSTSTEEFSDYSFIDSNRSNWNSPYRSFDDADGLTESSEAASPSNISYRGQVDHQNHNQRNGINYGKEWYERDENLTFLNADSTKVCRKSSGQRNSISGSGGSSNSTSSSGGGRDVDWGSSSCYGVQSSLQQRRRTAQTFGSGFGL
ncbi:Ubiquitinyl hydrolase 1 protein [Dioscorea alata]|uniref:Ubiquitinyl hydrolase 1 protein n=1 Tax=Dioscorea alata TaxID=55571 RepID=A0ACB7U568_DIOAL|nr:Ubiquitinyl hydrolase 1 protein [Dioscorea alata]